MELIHTFFITLYYVRMIFLFFSLKKMNKLMFSYLVLQTRFFLFALFKKVIKNEEEKKHKITRVTRKGSIRSREWRLYIIPPSSSGSSTFIPMKKELQSAVALGFPARGTNPYSEVLSKFTNGKQEKVIKSEFKEVLSRILLNMATGLKKDPIVILRIDGEDLVEFCNGQSYEAEIASIFSDIASPDKSLCHHVIEALGKLTVEQGIPPISDSWVINNIVEPVLPSKGGSGWDKPILDQVAFLEEFKKVALSIADRLKEQPVIVAHSENTFDGSGVNRLLSNKFELDKTLNLALQNLSKDRNGKLSKEYLRVALDMLSTSAGLPPVGAIEEMDKVIGEVFKVINVDDGKVVKEDEFKIILTEILGSIMFQLEGNPISVYSDSVVHEPLQSSSTETS